LVISDQDDRNNTVHLVAWSRSTPANALAEFEIQPTGIGNPVTLTAGRVGADTWESFWDIPDTLADGNYTLRAILYSDGEQIAAKEETIQINRSDVPPPPAAEAVEIDSPENGGALGVFTPKGARPNAVFNVQVSDGTRQVRALYTTSGPGDEPAWKACGSARVIDRAATVRCTLAEGDSALGVTAIAAVANKTPPPAEPQALADDSGDAHRVTPYAQVPTSIEVEPAARMTDVNTCFQLSAEVRDQQGLPIANVNVDVHATGPADQLRFGTMFDQTGQLQQNSRFQAPDKGVHTSENAINCFNKESLNKQGDHNRPAQNDDKHIESIDNTNNNGVFSFVLYADSRGGTNVIVFADADDDDVLGAADATGGASIGWGEAPPPPQRQLFLEPESSQSNTGECRRMVLTLKEGGNPVSGANVDVHASGPENNVFFCVPSDGTPSRVPDSGEHTTGRHDDGTIHEEGETNSSGQYIFGIVSNSQGATNVTGWFDQTEDDNQGSDEPAARAAIAWGGRSRSVATNLSIDYRSGAFKGAGRSREKRCRKGRQVTIKKQKKGRDSVVGSDTTNSKGRYSVRSRANGKFYASIAKKTFIASNGDTVTCRADKSRKIRVR
jgi:hypothetical protein